VQPVKPAPANAVPGIIETLSGGFEYVNRVLWVVAIPIITDLFLWLVPKLTAPAVFDQIRLWYAQMIQTYASMAGGDVDPSTLDQARQMVTTFATQAGHFNLLTLLVVNIASVPSILPPPRESILPFQISTIGALVGVVVATQILGILLGCLYLGVIGQQVRDGKVVLTKLSRRVWFYWLSVVGFIFLAIGLSLAISIPIGLAVVVIQLVAPGAGVALLFVVQAIAQVASILFLLYLFFLVDAIIVSEVGPIRAAVSSARVVANNFWSTVGFIVLVYVISLGMQQVWMALSGTTAGTLIAIVGNAYISSGLAAASLLYYKTRVSRLPAGSGVLGRVSA
jgi:hypothetical protein